MTLPPFPMLLLFDVPQDMRVAEGQAMTRAPVIWAAVDNTIISFFQVAGVDMLALL